MLLRDEATGSYKRDDDPGEPTTGLPRLSVTDEEAKLLEGIGAGRLVLEIGTGLGVSTRALARHARFVHTYDVDPWVRDNVWPTLPDNVGRLESAWNPRMIGYWDVCFIDADHDPQAVAYDINVARDYHIDLIFLHDARYANVRAGVAMAGARGIEIETEHGLVALYEWCFRDAWKGRS